MGFLSKSRTKTPRKSTASSTKDKRPNGNILSFFKKLEADQTLFVESNAGGGTPVVEEDIYDEDILAQFNEDDAPRKKRKLANGADEDADADIDADRDAGADADADSGALGWKTKSPKLSMDCQRVPPEIANYLTKLSQPSTAIRKGPFIVDSDSEDDEDDDENSRNNGNDKNDAEMPQTTAMFKPAVIAITPTKPTEFVPAAPPPAPSLLLHQEDSTHLLDDLGDENDMGGLTDDELGGEEFRERRFMEEQARLEADEDGVPYENDHDAVPDDGMAELCPICNVSLEGVTLDQANRHVNTCLDSDSTTTPVPRANRENRKSDEPRSRESRYFPTVAKPNATQPQGMSKAALAAVARPGQTNPFSDGSGGSGSGSGNGSGNGRSSGPASAFSKLMSGHAEDAAWANAAAAEHAARGKPAHQRTCPFYKIMPGLSICVDAFRYGAVEGCRAYFLSHFHSDHYIGLSARWSYGPIYCSQVTGRLVKQQLRVAAKWVIELDFEDRVEVPGTDGVAVTMISANHCPGSSMFLFEKTIGKGPEPRIQRILHCGDFRACPAHVAHPLLQPETRDAISGRTKRQKIDMCYLDTTYLNPRYSFPPQQDVIAACAALCVAISPDPASTTDVWAKHSRTAGSTKSKFFTAPKPPPSGLDGCRPAASNNPRRQRLLVVSGTYSIGKERICVAIAKALGSRIFATPQKTRILRQLDDAELTALLTTDPLEAQVHMQSLMEIRAETLQAYLDSYKPHFSRVVGLRPSGWNFRQAKGNASSTAVDPASIPTTQILHGHAWRTRFDITELAARGQRGSAGEALCLGVPYSEHSSFRELAMFVMALRIERVVPTVNVGSEASRRRMKGWLDRWVAERKRGGFVRVMEGEEGKGPKENQYGLWQGKDGKGGGAWW